MGAGIPVLEGQKESGGVPTGWTRGSLIYTGSLSCRFETLEQLEHQS